MNRKNTKLLADLCHWTKVLGMGTKKKKVKSQSSQPARGVGRKKVQKKKIKKKNTIKSGVEK